MFKDSEEILSREIQTPDYYDKSRYRRTDILKDVDHNTYYEFPDILDIPISPEDFYHRVTGEDEGRLDIVANNYYGNPYLWWVICIANNLKDPLSVPAGAILRIPSLNSLYGYRGVLL